MNIRTTAFAVIAIGVCFAILVFLCLFAQKRLLGYFLQGNIRQLDFLRSHFWIFVVIGGLLTVLGIWEMLRNGKQSRPAWGPLAIVLAGALIILGSKFIVHYQYELYCKFYLQKTDGVVSWQPAVQ